NVCPPSQCLLLCAPYYLELTTWRYVPRSSFFFFHDAATTEIYTLSLHDALPIWIDHHDAGIPAVRIPRPEAHAHAEAPVGVGFGDRKSTRLNSSHVEISYAVFCLKKKKEELHKTWPVDRLTEKIQDAIRPIGGRR